MSTVIIQKEALRAPSKDTFIEACKELKLIKEGKKSKNPINKLFEDVDDLIKK